MSVALYTHQDMLHHRPGDGHAESPERLRAVVDALSDASDLDLAFCEAPLAQEVDLRRVHEPAYIDRIFAIAPRDQTVELDSDTYRPGDTVKATVFVRPYKSPRQRVQVSLKLPADLPEGNYTGMVCDDIINARMALKDNPTLAMPKSGKEFLDAVRLVLVDDVPREHPATVASDQTADV